RILRHRRPAARRGRHHAGRTLPVVGDAVDPAAPRPVPRPAHRRGAHRGRARCRRAGAGGGGAMSRRAPLEGVRVADFTWGGAGPFAPPTLAPPGAGVTRVEPPPGLRAPRLLPPFAEFQAGPNRSGYFNQYNQGKKSITVDLKRSEGIEVAKRLCAASDVVV